MTLRIVGYSKPPEPDPLESEASELESLIWKLPVIHVEGESRGSDMDMEEVRKVKGSVRMVRDGAVRWSLVCSLDIAVVRGANSYVSLDIISR